MKSFSCSVLALLAVAVLAICARHTRAEKLPMFYSTSKGLLDGSHHFEMELRGSVATLKDKLSEKYDLPRDAFHVIWKGDEQLDNFDLNNCSGAPIGELRLECDFYQVNVVQRDGEIRTPYVGLRDDTIVNLKNRIAKKLNIPCELLRLMREDRELHDSEALEEFVAANGQDHDLSLAYKQGQIRVKMPSGELVTFGFEPTDQVGNLKDKIRGEKGIAREGQNLALRGKGELQDDALLITAGFSPGSILTLVERPPGEKHTRGERAPDEPIIVHVKMESRRLLMFEVETTDTVASLKDKISKAEEIPRAKLHLFIFKDTEMGDNRRLADYDIRSETVVDLRLCPISDSQDVVAQHHVHVELQGEERKFAQLEIKPDDTAASVKDRLRSELSIPQEHTLHLYFESQRLEDDKPMLEHVVNNGSLLYLMSRGGDGPEIIHVKLPGGRVVTFNIPLSSKVSKLENYIHGAYEKFPLGLQHISFNNQRLYSNSRLAEHKIVSGSTVNLYVNLNPIGRG